LKQLWLVRLAEDRAGSGFAVTGSGSKVQPSGEAIPYYRMVLPGA
jgi:hypothetical protein